MNNLIIVKGRTRKLVNEEDFTKRLCLAIQNLKNNKLDKVDEKRYTLLLPMGESEKEGKNEGTKKEDEEGRSKTKEENNIPA